MDVSESALHEVRKRRLLIDGCDAWLFGLIEPFIGQRVLEVGCGLGNLTCHLLDRELVVGIDTSDASVDHVNRTYSAHGNVHAHTCDATDLAHSPMKNYRFDTVVSLNVLEHIRDDTHVLRQIHDVLVPSGRVVLIVPAHMALYGAMDRSIGHFRRYTRGDLAQKLHQAGFKIRVQKYVNVLGALGWFLNGRVLRNQVAPIVQLKLFNKLIPLVFSLESKIEVPFGLSLISISERVR